MTKKFSQINFLKLLIDKSGVSVLHGGCQTKDRRYPKQKLEASSVPQQKVLYKISTTFKTIGLCYVMLEFCTEKKFNQFIGHKNAENL